MSDAHLIVSDIGFFLQKYVFFRKTLAIYFLFHEKTTKIRAIMIKIMMVVCVQYMQLG
jgi:hypothetical protein